MGGDSRLCLPSGAGSKLATRRIVSDYAPLLSHPKSRAAQQTELVHGQHVDVYAEQGQWALVQACSLIRGAKRAGYVGWIAIHHLGALQDPETHSVSAISAPVFARADLKSHIIMSLPLGAQVSVMMETEDYYQIGAGAYVSRHHLRILANPDRNLVSVARRYLGQPYIWGGNGARGVDCSGLVQMSLAACGIDSPRDADLQEVALGHAVDRPSQIGDLLFWPGHVGILATKTRLLHANATHMAVIEEPLGPALKRMERAGITLRTVKRL